MSIGNRTKALRNSQLNAAGTSDTLLCLQIHALSREELADWWKLYVAAVDKQLNVMDSLAPDATPPHSVALLTTLQREALALLTRCGMCACAFLLMLALQLVASSQGYGAAQAINCNKAQPSARV